MAAGLPPRGSLALVEGDQVVAVAGAFTPELHGRRSWAFVEVIPSARRRGVGSQALDALRKLLPPDSPLRCKVAFSSAGDHFARRHGLYPLQHTKTVRITAPPVDRDSDVGVVHANAVADEVVDAWRRYYLAGHSWDPPGDLPLSFWHQTLGSDDTLLTWPSDPPFRAIAVLGPDGSWTGGSIARNDPEAVVMTTDLLSAAGRLFSSLEVELDDWMTEVAEAVINLQPHQLDHSVILGERLPTHP